MSAIPGKHVWALLLLAAGFLALSRREVVEFAPSPRPAPAEWLSTYREACTLFHRPSEAYWFPNPDFKDWSSWFFLGTSEVKRTVGTCRRSLTRKDGCQHSLNAERIATVDGHGASFDVYVLLDTHFAPGTTRESDPRTAESVKHCWVVLIQNKCSHLPGSPWNDATPVEESVLAAWIEESPNGTVSARVREANAFEVETLDGVVCVRDSKQRPIAEMALPQPKSK